MRFEDCNLNMEVIFGRGNGEYTKGIVVKKNRVKAKVKTIEDRGRTDAGAVWSVPYSLMTPANGDTVPDFVKHDPLRIPISYSPFQDRVEQLILEAINAVYNNLSPENLTCDGELPSYMVNEKRIKLNRQLKGLFQAFGREVDEKSAFDWMMERNNQRKVEA